MAYKIKRPIAPYYIPLSDKIEKQLDNEWGAGRKGKKEMENMRSLRVGSHVTFMGKKFVFIGESGGNVELVPFGAHIGDSVQVNWHDFINNGRLIEQTGKGWHGDSIGHSLAALKAQAGGACNQAMEKPKLHRYYYSHRPPSIGTQPDGFINHESWMPMRDTPHGHAAFGWVDYDRPLTNEELYNYELFEDEPELPKLVKEIVHFAHDEGIDEAMKALDAQYGMAVWNYAKSQKHLKGNGQKEQIRNEIMRLAQIGG